MVSILFDLLTSKKKAPSLIRVEKQILQNWPQRVSTEAEFCADFKNVSNSCVKKFPKIFSQKKVK
jgi:hypothetical protein